MQRAANLCWIRSSLLASVDVMEIINNNNNRNKQTSWPEATCELYWPSSLTVSTNFRGYRVPHGQCDGSLWPYSQIYRMERLIFHSSSSSIVVTRLSGPCSGPNTSQKIWYAPDPILLRKSGSTGNRTETSGSVARNFWILGHRAGLALTLYSMKEHLLSISRTLHHFSLLSSMIRFIYITETRRSNASTYVLYT
jgi:hypothetical protein